MCEIYSKLTILTQERHHCCCCNVFVVNFEHISHFFSGSFVYFEQLNVCWVGFHEDRIQTLNEKSLEQQRSVKKYYK